MRTLVILVAVLSTALCWSSLAQAKKGEDVRGSSDHPVIDRYPGSYISKYRQVEFDEYELPLGRSAKKGIFEKSKVLEGKVTSLEYIVPEGRSMLEVYRNYEQALAKAGFRVLFQCAKHEGCGRRLGDYMGAAWYSKSRYLAAVGGDPSAPTYLALFVHKRGSLDQIGVLLRVIESRPMEGGLVEADASASTIGRALESEGKFALYGLYFETGKAELEPESEATIAEIAKLMKSKPGLKLYVVGHTDSTGQASANVALSERRAAAAVDALVRRHGIAKSRLTAKGVGPFAPVGSNQTEAGRAKNRRVELVQP